VTYIKVRRAGQIVTIAIAVNTDGRREVLGMATGARPSGPTSRDR
jgi:putative transposase